MMTYITLFQFLMSYFNIVFTLLNLFLMDINDRENLMFIDFAQKEVLGNIILKRYFQ